MTLILTALVLMLVASNINAQTFCFYSTTKNLVSWNVGCNFSGNDIEQTPGNFVDCIEKCVSNTLCTHFVSRYAGTTNTCYLKTVTKPQPNNFAVRTIAAPFTGLYYCGFIPMRTGDNQGIATCVI